MFVYERVWKKEGGKRHVRNSFSGNVLLNICEIDDTHLKKTREGRCEVGVIEGRKGGG